MFLIFTKYSGDLEFFQCQKSYLSHPIRHIVNSGHIYNSSQKLRKLPFIGFRVTLHNPKKGNFVSYQNRNFGYTNFQKRKFFMQITLAMHRHGDKL